MAEWLGKGLQNPVPRFDSGCRLSEGTREGCSAVRAISSGGERFLDAEEVSGSNPLSPTPGKLLFAGKTRSKNECPRYFSELRAATVQQRGGISAKLALHALSSPISS